MYQILFDLNTNLCDHFPALDPFRVREQRFHDVLLIFRRLNEQVKDKKRIPQAATTRRNGVIRRRATKDDWY
nr:MAG TPA: hypothetical protein [Caudoviricetes sp.]